jgi:hypothetical protein
MIADNITTPPKQDRPCQRALNKFSHVYGFDTHLTRNQRFYAMLCIFFQASPSGQIQSCLWCFDRYANALSLEDY